MAQPRGTTRALLLLPLLAAGCATLPRTTPGATSAATEDFGVRRTALEIRQRVDALVPAMVAVVEDTADRVRGAATDPHVRRRALRLKIDLVPVIYEAGLQTDPLVAGLDLWLLSYQLEQCFESAQGRCDFGAQQPLAREAGREQRQTLDRLFETASLNRDALDRERELVLAAARRHPLHEQESLRRRRSIAPELARTMNAQALTPFELLGDVSATLSGLSDRLSLYVEEAVRLAAWQAELLLEDMMGSPAIAGTLTDVGRATDSIERVSSALDTAGLNATVDRLTAAIRQERQATLADIDRQRALAMAGLTAERKALVETAVASLLRGVAAERALTLAAIHEERVETLAEVEKLRLSLIDDGFAESRKLVDYAIWRLTLVLGVGMALGAVLLWLVMRPRARRAGA